MSRPATRAGGQLVRDYIAHALYSPTCGYFVKRPVVGSIPKPIDFSNLLGKLEYKALLAELYRTNEWLTPCEIFKPWYSYALATYAAQWLLRQRGAGLLGQGEPLVVYEVGGGTGNNARHILDYMRTAFPKIYGNMQYSILEISGALHERQQASLESHSKVARSVHADATCLPAAGIHDPRPCLVIALEVLDNLPHDKIVKFAGDDGWRETRVLSDHRPDAASSSGSRAARREEYIPVHDEVILRWMDYMGDYSGVQLLSKPPTQTLGGLVHAALRPFQRMFGSGESLTGPAPPDLTQGAYIPTGAMLFLESLAAALPRHSLACADFNELPSPNVDAASLVDENAVEMYAPAANAPLVASKVEGRTVDHPCYLSAREGTADIFFATDFAALAHLWTRVQKKIQGSTSLSPNVLHPRDFATRYADVNRTRTLTGYNPLLEDYHNTRMLLT